MVVSSAPMCISSGVSYWSFDEFFDSFRASNSSFSFDKLSFNSWIL